MRAWPTSSPTFWSTPATPSPPRRHTRRDDALGDLRDVPGVYVFGSNDYWAPVFKNPLRYFLPNGGKKKFHGPRCPGATCATRFDDVGWVDLNNRRADLTVGRRDDRVRRRRRPAPRVRQARRRRRPGRPSRRPPARRDPRAVPAGARRFTTRRLRPDPRRAHARRPAAHPGLRRAGHQLRPRPRAGQGLHQHTRAGRARAPGCTSRPVSAPRRTRRSGSAATPRRRC